MIKEMPCAIRESINAKKGFYLVYQNADNKLGGFSF